MEYLILPAADGDSAELASLHAESWRSAYRGMLPDEFLAGPLIEDRLRFWHSRMNEPAPHRRLVLKVVDEERLLGFVCVMLDIEPAWGARLENFHVKPALRSRGIGSGLFEAARDWISGAAPGQPMHLWVIEQNLPARRFYDRRGGTIADRKTIEVVPGIWIPELRYVWPAT